MSEDMDRDEEKEMRRALDSVLATVKKKRKRKKKKNKNRLRAHPEHKR